MFINVPFFMNEMCCLQKNKNEQIQDKITSNLLFFLSEKEFSLDELVF